MSGWLVSGLPKNHLSRFSGWFAHQPLGSWLGPRSVEWFARRYRINLEEAEKELHEYSSIGDLFTRRLKPGLRPIAEGFAVHPCDAKLTAHGPIDSDSVLQAKGRHYSLKAFLGDEKLAEKFRGGHYVTYYLCPTDYHRVHSPVKGKITSSVHFPGKLWPVNEWSTAHVDQVFAVNERVVTEIKTDRGSVAVVMVGATNVGKIRMAHDPSVCTNRAGNRRVQRCDYHPPIAIERGDELGVFEIGSTVVALFPPGSLRPEIKETGIVTRVGGLLSR